MASRAAASASPRGGTGDSAPGDGAAGDSVAVTAAAAPYSVALEPPQQQGGGPTAASPTHDATPASAHGHAVQVDVQVNEQDGGTSVSHTNGNDLHVHVPMGRSVSAPASAACGVADLWFGESGDAAPAYELSSITVPDPALGIGTSNGVTAANDVHVAIPNDDDLGLDGVDLGDDAAGVSGPGALMFDRVREAGAASKRSAATGESFCSPADGGTDLTNSTGKLSGTSLTPRQVPGMPTTTSWADQEGVYATPRAQHGRPSVKVGDSFDNETPSHTGAGDPRHARRRRCRTTCASIGSLARQLVCHPGATARLTYGDAHHAVHHPAPPRCAVLAFVRR